MDTTFMKSRNSKKNYPFTLLLNISYEINFKKSGKYVALSYLII